MGPCLQDLCHERFAMSHPSHLVPVTLGRLFVFLVLLRPLTWHPSCWFLASKRFCKAGPEALKKAWLLSQTDQMFSHVASDRIPLFQNVSCHAIWSPPLLRKLRARRGSSTFSWIRVERFRWLGGFRVPRKVLKQRNPLQCLFITICVFRQLITQLAWAKTATVKVSVLMGKILYNII